MWKKKLKEEDKATNTSVQETPISPPSPPVKPELTRFELWAALPNFEQSYHVLEALESINTELEKLNATMLRIEANTR